MFEKGGVKMAKCPACEKPIALGKNVKLGARIECPECGELLEVISLKPLDLDYAFGDEDWAEEEI